MKVRFQADNDLRKAIVRGVIRSEPLIDFRSAPHQVSLFKRRTFEVEAFENQVRIVGFAQIDHNDHESFLDDFKDPFWIDLLSVFSRIAQATPKEFVGLLELRL